MAWFTFYFFYNLDSILFKLSGIKECIVQNNVFEIEQFWRILPAFLHQLHQCFAGFSHLDTLLKMQIQIQ